MIYKDKRIDKYSNYNGYVLAAWRNKPMAVEVSEERLIKTINSCITLLKNPYLRFMYVSKKGGGRYDEAMCVLYDGKNRLTRLVSISEIERMIEEKNFHE